MRLGERIAASREALGWSQAELGRRVGRSESWVSQVERGVRHLDRLTVREALAEALGVPYRELFPSIELNVLGEAKVDALVELLLDPAERHEALGLLSGDPMVQQVVRALAERAAAATGGRGRG